MMDVVSFYVDLGRPYAPLMERLTSSIRRHGVGQSVLITPTPHAEGCGQFDVVVKIDGGPEEATLMLQRGRANCSWLTQTQNDTMCVDLDVEFTAFPSIPCDTDIALLWRNKPDQRVNAACFFSRANQQGFWRRYAKVLANMPSETHRWWSDQMAFTLMLGQYHHIGETTLCDGSRVYLMDPHNTCSLPEEASAEAWALHYRGARKGADWKQYYAAA